MDKFTIFIFVFFLFLINKSYSQEKYYLTLRNDKVNLRQGPSFKHPVKLIYNKKFLPLLIQDKSENFRNILEHENKSESIHFSQLSKKKAALNNEDDSIIFKKPSKYSKPLAIAKKGRLLLIKKCKNNWCKIKTGKYKGWIEKEKLKGRL